MLGALISSQPVYLEGKISAKYSFNIYNVFILIVDCWDGPDGEPVVHHGYTLTSKIPFKDVIDVINKNAFTKNE